MVRQSKSASASTAASTAAPAVTVVVESTPATPATLSGEKKVKKTKSDDDDDDRPSPAFVDPPADVVKKIDFEGKKYLKSKNTGIIYNMDQDVIGKWNEEKQRIDFTEVDEESEDEYEEDE